MMVQIQGFEAPDCRPAEQLYLRCHRRIVSDYLKARERTVIHTIGKGKIKEHELTSFAKVIRGELRYSRA